MTHKWRHQARFDAWKNKLRVHCVCGMSSPAFCDTEMRTREEQAKAWYQDHVGLKEVTKEVRGENDY